MDIIFNSYRCRIFFLISIALSILLTPSCKSRRRRAHIKFHKPLVEPTFPGSFEVETNEIKGHQYLTFISNFEEANFI